MIYTYKALTHRISSFNENINFFFEQLFIYSPAKYDEKLLVRPLFIPIINASPISLLENLKQITQAFYVLTEEEQTHVMLAYFTNTDIESICNDVNTIPIKFEELPESISDLLKHFTVMLWESYPQNELLKSKCGTVQEHFEDFRKIQGAHVCPFCGLLPLKPAKGIYRNAYDHYIPKAFYPFVSVNYQNLFPICTDCNSDEKKAIDTPYIGVVRRSLLFPLDTKYKGEQLSVSITTSESYDKKTLKTLLDEINWDLAIQLAGANDPRLVSWNEIFHIKRRYKEHLIDFQKTWFDDFIVKRYKEDKADGLSFYRFKTKLLGDAKGQIKDNPLSILRYVYFNFLFSIPDFETKLNETIS